MAFNDAEEAKAKISQLKADIYALRSDKENGQICGKKKSTRRRKEKKEKQPHTSRRL